jgi:hemoglobin-like flavoprotein
MSEWLDRLLNDPMRENGWSAALMLVLASAAVLPLVVMMWRDRRMFRWKRETTVSDQKTTGVDLGDAQRLPEVPDHRPAEQIDDEQTARWKEEGIGQEPDTLVQQVPSEATTYDVEYWGRGIRSFAVATVPTPIVQPARITCGHCEGRGFVPGINDLLQESIALLGDAGDEVIRTFYVDLFRRDPDLAGLFPGNPTKGDFGTDHRGAQQRERLLEALKALANLYDPGKADAMEHLDQSLARFGRAHASFVRKDGTIKGATWEEYAAVKDALFTTLVRAAGEHWRAEYTEAWSQAYDYAAGVMLVEQFRSGFAAPRFPRA